MAEWFIGLMSGTSLDGVDGVVCDHAHGAGKVLAHCHIPLAGPLRLRMARLNQPGPNELHEAALAANALVRVYAAVVAGLLAQTGLPASAIEAIGAHGQTVRHQPQAHDATGYTWQLNNPALLAELTGITVVADFRNRDIAAGGQGAPLVPAFHQAWFGRRHADIMVLNLGGIANLTVLSTTNSAVLGFDCGPGNTLMDAWCQQHLGLPFDANGAWAASGSINPALTTRLLREPYFQRALPKSTGLDLFNLDWLAGQLSGFSALEPVDVQASLLHLTVQSCADACRHCGAGANTLIVCGGGALNGELMRQLQAALPGVQVVSSQAYGLPPLQVEAAAFAWLARRALRGEPANLPGATGARGARILGAIYPA